MWHWTITDLVYIIPHEVHTQSFAPIRGRAIVSCFGEFDRNMRWSLNSIYNGQNEFSDTHKLAFYLNPSKVGLPFIATREWFFVINENLKRAMGGVAVQPCTQHCKWKAGSNLHSMASGHSLRTNGLQLIYLQASVCVSVCVCPYLSPSVCFLNCTRPLLSLPPFLSICIHSLLACPALSSGTPPLYQH